MAEKEEEEAKIEIAEGRVTIETWFKRDPKTNESFRLLKYGGYKIFINQTKLVKLAGVPDLDSLIILSLEEGRDLLKHWGFDFHFAGRICHKYGPGGEYRPVVFLNLKDLTGKDGKKTKAAVVEALGHEMRHAKQRQEKLPPEKGFWRFMSKCGNFFKHLKKKGRFFRSLLKAPLYLLAFFFGFTATLPLSPVSLAVIAPLVLLAVFYVLIYDESFWDPIERDARKFAKKVVKDEAWRACVIVTKKAKSSS